MIQKPIIFIAQFISIFLTTSIVGGFIGFLFFFILKSMFPIDVTDSTVYGLQLYLGGILFGYRLKILIENHNKSNGVPLSEFLVNAQK